MRTIRRNTFETNSSSTHSLTMCTESDFEKLQRGELYVERWGGYIRTKEEYEKERNELTERFKQTNPEYLDDDDTWEQELFEYIDEYAEIVTFERWMDLSELEYFQESFTTPNGEKVIAFGEYGYN